MNVLGEHTNCLRPIFPHMQNEDNENELPEGLWRGLNLNESIKGVTWFLAFDSIPYIQILLFSSSQYPRVVKPLYPAWGSNLYFTSKGIQSTENTEPDVKSTYSVDMATLSLLSFTFLTCKMGILISFTP